MKHYHSRRYHHHHHHPDLVSTYNKLEQQTLHSSVAEEEKGVIFSKTQASIHSEV